MHTPELLVSDVIRSAGDSAVGEETDRHVDLCFPDQSRALAPEEPEPSQIAPCRVGEFYDAQIRRSGYYEQLRRIVEPSPEELHSPGHWDTSGEHSNTVLTGLQHKYPQTALVLTTDRCFSYCRFCFRKRFVGVTSAEIAVGYPAIAAYVWQHPEISNVLISGGDPLVLSTKELRDIVAHFLPIPHVGSIRFGTKSTVYHPQRFRDADLKALFEEIVQAGKVAAVATHVDHVGEMSQETEDCMGQLRAIGVQMFNQAVLLRRVNDDPEVLVKTFRVLHGLGVRPYYLFQARPVRQGSHFQVPLERGIRIVQEAYRRLSGIEKTFRYVMSHVTGKIEILDLGIDGRVYMRYHQCTDPGQVGRVFSRPYRDGACWLDDLPRDTAEAV